MLNKLLLAGDGNGLDAGAFEGLIIPLILGALMIGLGVWLYRQGGILQWVGAIIVIIAALALIFAIF